MVSTQKNGDDWGMVQMALGESHITGMMVSPLASTTDFDVNYMVVVVYTWYPIESVIPCLDDWRSLCSMLKTTLFATYFPMSKLWTIHNLSWVKPVKPWTNAADINLKWCCWCSHHHFPTVPSWHFSRRSQDLVDARIKLWAPRSVPGLSGWFERRSDVLLIFHAWNFVVSLFFFLTFTVIILWCVGVLSSLSRFWKQTHGGDVLQLDHLETSLFPIFLLKNHHFSYGFLKEWLVNSPGPGNLMDISRPKSKS